MSNILRGAARARVQARSRSSAGFAGAILQFPGGGIGGGRRGPLRACGRRSMRRNAWSLSLLLALAVLAPSAEGQPGDTSARLTDVTVEPQREGTAVQITTTGAVRYRATVVDVPPRLVLDFADTTYAWRRAPLAVSADPVKQVSGSQPRRNVARVVIDLTRKSEYTIEETPSGLRVLLPASPEALARAQGAAPSSAPAIPPRSSVIAQAPAVPPAARPGAPLPDGRRLISLDFKDADV